MIQEIFINPMAHFWFYRVIEFLIYLLMGADYFADKAEDEAMKKNGWSGLEEYCHARLIRKRLDKAVCISLLIYILILAVESIILCMPQDYIVPKYSVFGLVIAGIKFLFKFLF